MRALVIYESMFGNTKTIAEAVAAGLSPGITVQLVEVADAPLAIEDDVALLVVGGPTHALSMSRQETRRSAAEQANGAVLSTGIGLREWLATVRPGRPGVAAAAFDTRIRMAWLPGSAARAAAKRLRRLRFDMLAPAESFYVAGTPGPLLDGEAQRAHRWAQTLRMTLAVRQSHRAAS